MWKYAISVLLVAGQSSYAQTSYPTLLGVHPTAVQRGTATEILVFPYRSSLKDAYTLLFDGEGGDFQVEVLSDGTQVPLKVRLTVAAEAPLGVREFRVVTKHGVSSVAALVVSDEAGVDEVEPNDSPDKPQSIMVPVTINGRLDRDADIDWYTFQAQAGDDVSISVISSRLQFKLYFSRQFIDPLLVLTDASGRELAHNDDYFSADPLIRYHFERSGEYRVGIRDSQNHGEAPSPYRLMITRQPYVLNLFPPAVTAGQEVEFRSVQAGEPPRPLASVKTQIPADWKPGHHELVLPLDGGPSNLVPIHVTDLPISQKSGTLDQPDSAQVLDVNSGVNGWLDAPGDIDWFRFSARQGTIYVLEVFARRYQSDMDAVLSVHDSTGKQLAISDDTVLDTIPSPNYRITNTKDSRLFWTAPADGTYQLRLTDAHGNGGTSCVYFLSCRTAQPDFILRCDPADKANLGPGCSVAWHFHLERLHGFAGPVQVDVQGLPEGVTASKLVIHEKKNQGCLVLTAAADSKVNASLVRVTGSATIRDAAGQEATIVRDCRPIEEIYHFGGREFCMVNTQVVAVTDQTTLVITPSTTDIQLTPGGEVRVEFEVRRGTDLPANATLALSHMVSGFAIKFGADPFPAGVTVEQAKSKLRLAPSETKGWIVLNVAPSTEPFAEIPFSLLAPVASDSRQLVMYSTPAIYLTVNPSSATAVSTTQ